MEKNNLGLVPGDSPCIKIVKRKDHFSIFFENRDLDKKSIKLKIHNDLFYSMLQVNINFFLIHVTLNIIHFLHRVHLGDQKKYSTLHATSTRCNVDQFW